MKQLLVSPSPHVHGKDNTRNLMRDVVIALLPAVAVSIYFFGLSAIKMLVVALVSCLLVEWLIQKFLFKGECTICDWSAAVTAVLLMLNLPPAAPWWIMVIGAVVAIGIAKMTFGGLGQNPFNPALVGRVFLLISFPVIMTTWTTPEGWFGAHVDAVSGATPLALVKEALKNGASVQEIFAQNPGLSYSQLLFARVGSAGEISAIALLIGFVYLLARKVIRPHITLSIWVSVFVFAGILWLANPERFVDPVFQLLTGGMLLGSIFMATDYVTSPMNPKGQIIFGCGIGIITVLIRTFGAYPEGISFAILIMNAVVPLINMYVKPKRFGRK